MNDDNNNEPVRTESPELAAPVDFSEAAVLPFPVVGVGASAGGIEALGALLEAMPPDSGMAFIMIQHLPPDHQSRLAEVLGRRTLMPVQEIADGMPVAPNQVYVSRPGHTVTLEGQQLRLGEPVEERGHRRPVDDLFRSLARVQREKAIIVVLSGVGTNGTSGAQAVKAAGGLCIAQDPDSADFGGMPSSLIQAGYADQVLKVADIPAVLLRYVQHPYLDPARSGQELAEHVLRSEPELLKQAFAILRTRTSHNFVGYKKPTVMRRIQRRMGLHGMTQLQDYVELLHNDFEEAKSLANDMMINVTGFFRDPEAWEGLRTSAVAPLLERCPPDGSIRVWVTACASGEEAYTLGMLLMEEMERQNKYVEFKIFATDTADKALGFARSGIYPTGIEGDLDNTRLLRFFDKDEHTYRIKKSLRDSVVFAAHDLLRDPPFSRVDLCTCRNLLIYLEPEVQQRVLFMLHFALREGGYLFLGNAESPGPSDKLFQTVSKKWRIYQRAGIGHHPLDLSAISNSLGFNGRRDSSASLPGTRAFPTIAVQQALLEQNTPATVVVDRTDRVLYVNGDTTPYTSLSDGNPTRNLFDILRPSLRNAARTALRRAAVYQQPISILAELTDDGYSRSLKLTAAPLPTARIPDFFRLTFEPAKAGTSVEAFEASNEELQSANEELETGKEELQSLNEELITVNAQLQAKVAELEATTNDLSNLLSSTNIAVVFLDPEFRVRRFTPAVYDLLELIPGDIGRPIANLAQKFHGSGLLEDARTVLARLIPQETEVLSHSGSWYLRRTLPYRTADNHIDGVVITFVDITARRAAELALKSSQARLQAVVEQLPIPMLMVDVEAGTLLHGNEPAAKLLGMPYPLPLIGSEWKLAVSSFQGTHIDGRPLKPEEWPLARSIREGVPVDEEEIDYTQADGKPGVLAMSSTPVKDTNGEVVVAVAIFMDITERRRAAEKLRESEQRLHLLIESALDYAIFMIDLEGRIMSWNRGAERLLGWSEQEALGRPGEVIFTIEDRIAGVPEQELQAARAHGRAVDERVHQRKNGERFWANGMLMGVYDDKGTLCRYAKIIRDETERKAAEDELQRALREAERERASAEDANRAKDEFISTISHELRTPLNTIRLWARMLSSDRLSEQDRAEGIRMIDRSAESQQHLIDDLLDVSRMSSGQLRLNLRETRLVDAVRAAIDSVQPSADVRRVRINSQLSNAIGAVRADPERIQQIVWNLVTNAVKFTPPGGHVDVRLSRDEDSVIIEVQDTGVGIRSDFLPHVFERFRQAEVVTTRQHGGLGLGLAIAKQLVELHGGAISAHSAGPGQGATFTVRLPLPPLSMVANEQTQRLVNLDSQLAGLRILLVEDDEGSRVATCRAIELRGARVTAVGDAAAALTAYTQTRPDAVVLDIGLPGEDGYSLIQRIRNLETAEQLPRTAVIALTAFARTQDRKRCLDAGFDEHLSKPLDLNALTTAIVNLTGNSSGQP